MAISIWKVRHIVAILTCLSALVSSQIAGAPFDCRRFTAAHCCSTRIRESCPQICGGSPCNRPRPFIANFLTQLPPMSQVAGGGLPPFGSFPPPQQPPPALWGQPPPPRPSQPTPQVAELIPRDGHSRQQPAFRPPLPDPQPPPGLVLPPAGTPLSNGPPSAEPDPDWESRQGVGINPQPPQLPQAPPPSGPSIHASSGGHPFSIPASVPATVGPPEPTPFPTLISNIQATTVIPQFGPFFGSENGHLTSSSSIPPPDTSAGNGHWSARSTSQGTSSGIDSQPELLPWTNGKDLATGSQGQIGQSKRDSNSRSGKASKSGVITPPSTGGAEDLVQLEGEDAAVTTIEKQSVSNHFGDIQDGIAQSITLGSHTERVTTSPHFRTTRPEPDGRVPWSFKIQPSSVQTFSERDLPLPEDKDEFVEITGNHSKRGFEKNSTAQGAPSKNSTGLGSGGIFSDRTRAPRPKKGPKALTTSLIHPTRAPEIATSTLATLLSGNGSHVGQCGVAPDFRPCVGLEEANRRLLGCCRGKNMPEGCLPLCRFDTTQPEIKRQFDTGKCGILNVAPFLECASQQQDNRQCCHASNVSLKSGPQCEVFCHPRDGLGSLGLQHLVCQNVISDLLKCHHSGLKV
ncbi:unnamed protein product [Bursaphelenchus xylophilus]|uniref:(pine wood nematode) hypothetical protein n=1 Tax=Bursaphelenchus xylophilus TaxID=6326 RepID=A0A7I8XC04_BURXY|nr:unnamed protein product [Bursaphelenchus xylophilus]CAG9131507.1 unnamed protein product [Bursaphelenchus xylophilus]